MNKTLQKEKRTVAAHDYPPSPLERQACPGNARGRIMHYSSDDALKPITIAALLEKSDEQCSRIWQKMGPSKFGLFRELDEEDRSVLEKKLMLHAYTRADRDFEQDDRETFRIFGRHLYHIPHIDSMEKKDRAAALYSHYLRFLNQQGVTFPCGHTDERRENSVRALREHQGRCGEFCRTLQDLFAGAGISCTTVECWSDIKKDWKGMYRKDQSGMAGTGATHRALKVGDDAADEGIYDPVMYMRESGEWAGPRSWRDWVDYHHRHGCDGPLDFFADGTIVREVLK